ncbi:hypothetical protein STCU_05552 [Strigomonas culicis]|uniref:POT family protein n=1 Tax=Strigomonas culicis TaxID=28005 RepID=S9VL07_9TRYP|nr:hypothetical protein STCU_05552 [Strigomonas culicis]|eukprot:EPY27786.1 hypothetical protein STCU_05552 [Strigomonas culicis]
MVFDFPKLVWIVMGIDFAERVAYYTVAFSLYTYCVHMLRTGYTGANAITNAVYVVIPLSACAASGLADGPIGRPRILLSALYVYAAGLILLFASSLPFLFGSFPADPYVLSYVLFAVALATFGAGYGGMKVCTYPLMADSITARYAAADFEPRGVAGDALVLDRDAGSGEDEGPVKHRGAGLSAPSPSSASDLEYSLQRLFRVSYWTSNFGALVGIFVGPLLRNLDARTIQSGSATLTTGYYWSYFGAALVMVPAAVVFWKAYTIFPKNKPAPSFIFFRLLGRAVYYKCLFLVGRVTDEEFVASHRGDFLAYALYRAEGRSQQPHRTGYQSTTARDVTVCGAGDTMGGSSQAATARPVSPAATDGPPQQEGEEEGGLGANAEAALWVTDCRQTLHLCVAFVALPVYWMLCNQFSTNIMFQAEALNLPSWVPAEMFNNINTFTIIVFLLVCEKYVYERLKAKGHRAPPPHVRTTVGFVLMAVTMVWCGFVQISVRSRGFYNSDDAYQLHDGASKLSAGWLVLPYILQGVAAALVDPSVLEVAYGGAPPRMKGTVMGLYWVASSASGFLGMVFSPIMKPQHAVSLFFVFAVAQLAITAGFYYLNAKRPIPTVELADGSAQNSTIGAEA